MGEIDDAGRPGRSPARLTVVVQGGGRPTWEKREKKERGREKERGI